MVDDDETRRALFRRFLESQANAQTDPWAERASGKVDAQVFAPLATVEA